MIENFSSKFLAFCKSKPATEMFDCGSPINCALGKFVAQRGFQGGAKNYYRVDPETGSLYEAYAYPREVYGAVIGLNDEGGPEQTPDYYSFGKLVQRLEAAGVK